jgi:hydrogenase maturation protease
MSGGLWIIGYGNPGRRDDGFGFHVASQLRARFGDRESITIRSLHQLDPTLAEELGKADEVVFVDASVEEHEGSVAWRKVLPEQGMLPPMTHHLKPSFLMGLVRMIEGRCPEAWLVSAQGEDFGVGEGLSPSAEKMAEQAAEEVASHVLARG